MYGVDIERILKVITDINGETANQINLLARESDHRLTMIKHTHNVHVVSFTGSGGENSGAFEVTSTSIATANIVNHADTGHSHGIPQHKHTIDIKLQGNSPTKGVGKESKISDQLTYSEDYNEDKHEHHKHVEDSTIYEKEHPLTASTYTDPLVELGDTLQEDIDKLKQIQEKMYTDVTEFNNGYGSPWTEIYDIKSKIDLVKDYADTYPNLQWIGEKFALLNLIQMIFHTTIDAKWALIHYHDWVQRAYDNQFNDNAPSISWNHFEKGKTIGNIDQEFGENVRIPTPNEDPF